MHETAYTPDVLQEPGLQVSTPELQSRFVKHAFVFTAANVLYLALQAVLTFLLPRLLTVESFGYYRLFILYSGFVGVLHFGYLDGLLIRWAAAPNTLPRQ